MALVSGLKVPYGHGLHVSETSLSEALYSQLGFFNSKFKKSIRN